jgi:hypothetical protein
VRQDGGVTSAPVLLPRRLAAELPGSAFLAAIVIGSGIAAVPLIGKVLYPALTPAQAGAAVVPHETADGFTAPAGDAGRAARAPGTAAGQPENGR